jgi:hypothetical protein
MRDVCPHRGNQSIRKFVKTSENEVIIPYGVLRKMRNLKTQVKYGVTVAEKKEAEDMSYMNVRINVWGGKESYPRFK